MVKHLLAGLLVCASSLTSAQRIKPKSLFFEGVPPNTSPREGIVFANTGTAPLNVSVRVSGPPFSIAENRCANAIKPGTHCNVYLTYMPTNVGDSDAGTLTFDYGNGVAVAQLTGRGVSAIATALGVHTRQCKRIWLGGQISLDAKLLVGDKYYALPIGEPVRMSCTNGQENVDLGSSELLLCKGRGCPGGPYAHAVFGISPDQPGTWTCRADYDGDGILGASAGTIEFEIVTSDGHCH